MGDADRLTQEELAVVLRRVAELDQDDRSDQVGGLPIGAVEVAAEEVGVAPEHVRQAVAELRAGMLGDEHIDGAEGAVPPDRGTVIAARVVSWEPERVLDAMERFLDAKSMERVRDRGTIRVYRRRKDIAATLNRAIDFGSGSTKLESVEVLDVRAIEVTDGTLVRLVAELDRGLTNSPPITAGAAGVATGVAAGVGLALQIDPDLAGAALGAPVGAGFGVGGWLLARSVVDRRRRLTSEVLNGLLDEMEQGREPAARSVLARLRRRLPDARRGRRA